MTPFCQIIINYCFCSKQALSNVGAVFGSFIAIFIADRVGRKDTLLILQTVIIFSSSVLLDTNPLGVNLEYSSCFHT